MEWTVLNGAPFGMSTNNLLFPCSYYHYHQFYMNDAGSTLALRKLPEVVHPTRKALSPCFANGGGGLSIGGHSPKGSPFLFVDGHSQFATLRQLNPGMYGDYNLDWTEGGLAGADLR